MSLDLRRVSSKAYASSNGNRFATGMSIDRLALLLIGRVHPLQYTILTSQELQLRLEMLNLFILLLERICRL